VCCIAAVRMWARAPIFFWCLTLAEANLHSVIAQTVQGLGYDLVEFERSGRGLLRVMIDLRQGNAGAVKIEDCERVSRQLSQVLLVENIDYARLQVESPGVDRPLKTVADYVRFTGSDAVVKLRLPLAGRKMFTGKLLEPRGEGLTAKLLLAFEGKQGEEQVLEFLISEVDRAHLNPVLDFKKGMR
jgi:ribosome maturation factor RimP